MRVVWKNEYVWFIRANNAIINSVTRELINPLNAELNPICHLLALLEGATIVDVSGLRVNHCSFLLVSGKRISVLCCRDIQNPYTDKRENMAWRNVRMRPSPPTPLYIYIYIYTPLARFQIVNQIFVRPETFLLLVVYRGQFFFVKRII